jgi:type VI secretion system secreted protein VgrG
MIRRLFAKKVQSFSQSSRENKTPKDHTMSDSLDFQTLQDDPQNARLLRLSFPNGDAPEAPLLLNRLDGAEFISRDFEFRLELLSSDASVALEELQGKLLCASVVQASGDLRHFTGHISQFKLERTDGGVAFYAAILVPWFALTRLRQNNRLFHNQNLEEQTAAVFAHYGALAKWEWQVSSADTQFTMATQWMETDHNYLSRRLEAAGFCYWYEHTDEGHTLRIVSDTLSAQSIEGETVRYHSAGGPEDEDAIGQWAPKRVAASGQVSVSGFDFKNPKPVHSLAQTVSELGDIPALEVHHYAGHYGFKPGGSQALANLYMQEMEARAYLFEAHGNCTRMVPGYTFTLTEHFEYSGDAAQFLILEIHHHATNNYLQTDTSTSPEKSAQYTNRLICQPKTVPWYPGLGFASTLPKLTELQTATVVGPANEGSLHVDEYGRIRVKFNWDRDETSSAWVRVSTSWAGGEKGISSLPRVGSEVIVQWLDGNPDHPLVTGAVHNQNHMPPWKLPAQRALMGIRSRELSGGGGNTPGGRSNHMLLDDTEGKIQAQIKSDHMASQLSLGHINRIEDNAGRKEPRGQGFELRTDGHGAVRAKAGLLISTHPRANAQNHITDMAETVESLTQAQGLHDGLSQVALEAKAHEASDQAEVAKALKLQTSEIKGQGGDLAQGEYPEFNVPHLTLASPKGIELTAQGSSSLSAAEHIAITSGLHTSISTGQSLLVSSKNAVRMFSHKEGMRFIAGHKDIDLTALQNSINLLAKLSITETAECITLKATKELRIVGGGSFTTWSAGGITHGTAGVWKQHAADHKITTAASTGSPRLPEKIGIKPGQLDLFHHYIGEKGKKKQGVKQGEYTVTDSEGAAHQGKLDAQGFASITGLPAGGAKISFGADPRNPWDEASHFGESKNWQLDSVSATEALGGPGPIPKKTANQGSASGALASLGGAGQPDLSSLSKEKSKLEKTADSLQELVKKAKDKVQALKDRGMRALNAAQEFLGKGIANILPIPEKWAMRAGKDITKNLIEKASKKINDKVTKKLDEAKSKLTRDTNKIIPSEKVSQKITDALVKPIQTFTTSLTEPLTGLVVEQFTKAKNK